MKKTTITDNPQTLPPTGAGLIFWEPSHMGHWVLHCGHVYSDGDGPAGVHVKSLHAEYPNDDPSCGIIEWADVPSMLKGWQWERASAPKDTPND